MHRAFQRFNQILDLLVARTQACVHCDRGYPKSLLGLRIAAGGQASAQQSVHSAFEGFARTPLLLLHEPGNVVVNGQSGSHIMMLC